ERSGQHLMKLAVAAQHPERFHPFTLNLLTTHTARQREKRDQSKENGSDRIANEQPEISAFGEKARRRRAKRPAGVERHAIRGKGSDALAGRNQVGQQRAAGRAIQFAGQSGERGSKRIAGKLRACESSIIVIAAENIDSTMVLRRPKVSARCRPSPDARKCPAP